MRQIALISACFVLVGCDHSPTGPSPQPQPITVSGTLTDTVSGAVLGTFVHSVNALPALVDVSAPGHLPRRARITSSSPTVDLIPDAAPFDLGFYRQLVRNGYEAPGALEPVRVLTASPSIYMQTTGLQASTVAAYEAAARAVVPALTGGRLSVVAWETGETVRATQAGWIVVELMADDAANCGRATIGVAAGHVWINTAAKCRRNGDIVGTPSLFAHELGHTLGFRHVERDSALMHAVVFVSAPSDAERYHAAIAYARSSGNTDVDQDALTSATLAPMISD